MKESLFSFQREKITVQNMCLFVKILEGFDFPFEFLEITKSVCSSLFSRSGKLNPGVVKSAVHALV